MNKKEAFNIILNKWVQLVINGDTISEEQALEIIRRTDSAFYGEMSGNNHDFITEANKILKKPKMDYENIEKYIQEEKLWKEKWKLVNDLNYLKNNWVSCSWIGGCHGWCHPDGTIGFCNNIGKYPEVKEIYDELSILGKEFPFLNLICTITDREESEDNIQSLVTITLNHGKIDVIDPIPYEQLELNGTKFSNALSNFLFCRKENYFKLDQLKKWADKNL